MNLGYFIYSNIESFANYSRFSLLLGLQDLVSAIMNDVYCRILSVARREFSLFVVDFLPSLIAFAPIRKPGSDLLLSQLCRFHKLLRGVP